MNALCCRAPIGLAAFLAWEARQPDRFELLDGRVRRVATPTPAHERIVLNLYLALRARLRTKSRRDVHRAALKVVAREAGAVLYPDVFVRCGPLLREECTALDPVVVFLVGPASGGDGGIAPRRRACRSIASVRSVVLVDQGRPRLGIDRRSRAGWTSEAIDGLKGVLELEEIRVRLPLVEIYEAVGSEVLPVLD